MSDALRSEEGFLRRWARLKSSGGDAVPAPAPAPAPVPASVPAPAPRAAPGQAEAEARPLPTLEDVVRLAPDADDFSAFVARGVDKTVQRLALKKMFTDPHFHAIDGLDMYMSDYNKAAPIEPDMLASLKHAPNVLSRLLGDRQEEQQEQQAEQQEGAQASAQQAAPPSTRQGNA